MHHTVLFYISVFPLYSLRHTHLSLPLSLSLISHPIRPLSFSHSLSPNRIPSPLTFFPHLNSQVLHPFFPSFTLSPCCLFYLSPPTSATPAPASATPAPASIYNPREDRGCRWWREGTGWLWGEGGGGITYQGPDVSLCYTQIRPTFTGQIFGRSEREKREDWKEGEKEGKRVE